MVKNFIGLVVAIVLLHAAWDTATKLSAEQTARECSYMNEAHYVTDAGDCVRVRGAHPVVNR